MGALQVKNAHMRAACLARNLLVVDEVHASDTYMSVVLEALLNAHVGAGGYALLMSATLGSVARHRWLYHGQRLDRDIPALDEAVRVPYPAVSALSGEVESITPAGENDQEKTVFVRASPSMHQFADTARRALTAARAGAKVLSFATPSATPSAPSRPWKSWPITMTRGCCSTSRGRRPCITAGSLPATAQCSTSE